MKQNPPRKAPPGRNGFRYRPKFGLVVMCRDEAHQAELYRRLAGQGLKLRVVAV